MAQSSIFDASGLERDCRQDELPTVYSHNDQTLHHENPHVISEINSDLPLHRPATKPPGRLCGLRKSTFWLMALLLVLLVFTGVGAGVLGSRMRSSEQKR